MELQDSFQRTWDKTAGVEMESEMLEAVVFALSTYVGSLQGYETVKTHLPTLVTKLTELSVNKTWDEDLPHYGLPLIGRFKTETGERAFVIPMTSTTASGLQPLKWTIRLLKRLDDEKEIGRNWLFAEKPGSPKQAKMKKYEKEIFSRLGLGLGLG